MKKFSFPSPINNYTDYGPTQVRRVELVKVSKFMHQQEGITKFGLFSVSALSLSTVYIRKSLEPAVVLHHVVVLVQGTPALFQVHFRVCVCVCVRACECVCGWVVCVCACMRWKLLE